VPVLQTFTYRVPEELIDLAMPGMRIRVPFGRRHRLGCIVDITEGEKTPGVRDALAFPDAAPLLDASLLALCRWVADYYCAPLGLVLRAALPPGTFGRARGSGGLELKRQVIQLTRDLPTLLARERTFGRAGRQREAFEALEALGGRAAVTHMTDHLGFGRSVLAGLVSRQVAEIRRETIHRDPFASLPGDSRVTATSLTPTPQQRVAIDSLGAHLGRAAPGTALLHGVTGSGKTLVYLHLIDRVLRTGGSVLVLIPEIALTPQTVSRFRSHLGDDTVAVLHSGLSSGERHDAWNALRTGDRRVAIGTRSAVFAPLQKLGLVVVDEEHDASYKQSETPRYHARSVAAMRARLEGALCLLGSATPSMESWKQVKDGRYLLVELPSRVTPHPLPQVQVIDLRAERRAAHDGAQLPVDKGPTVLTTPLREALTDCLARGEQAILLLNRRGYSTFAQCRECGHVWSCRRCNVSLTLHRRRSRLVCHHCGFEVPIPERCPECTVDDLAFTGLGTEQVERRLVESFPSSRVARMDVDTTSGKWSHYAILERVRKREVDILLGTQMIAKGLDFPGVTLVGVINADVGLHLPDFRASERTFQLLEQVAGRAGRGDRAGRVLIQTSHPRHFALTAAVEHDYAGFARQELADREIPGYPPARRLANLVISGPSEERVAEAASELAEWTCNLVAQRESTGIEVVGPAPCAIDRLRGRWRWHFFLKGDSPAKLGAVLRYLATHRGDPGGRMRVEIDRDPESLL